MSLRGLMLSVALAVSAPFACQRFTAQSATISAHDVLMRTQQLSGANYTFDRDTSESLTAVRVPEPPPSADREALETVLREAGFSLRALPVQGKEIFLVEAAGG